MYMSELIDRIGGVRANPTAIQRVVIEALEEASNGNYGVVDPSNPFVFLLESSVASAAANFDRMDALMRRQYPSLAQTEMDLYHHMSDQDYQDRFATPAKNTIFTLMLSEAEIKERAIDTGGGVRKMVIPKDTEILIEGLYFTLQYPIEIRVMPHGGLQIVYDVDRVSPLQSLESNLLRWQSIRMPPAAGDLAHTDLVAIDIPMYQMRLEPHYDQLNRSTGFNKTYAFNDQFYYARVYTATGANGDWVEIKTTHSDQVYDRVNPTAILMVSDNTLNVRIPQIYLTDDLVGKGVRIDIYSTRGDVNLLLERYEPKDYRALWRDLDRVESPLNEAIRSFTTITMYSTDRVQGGKNRMSLETLRQRVIDNALGEIKLPITPVQLESKLDTLGYRIVKDIDNVTNRTYLASRELPIPNQALLATAMGCSVMAFQSSFLKLSYSRWVKEHPQRLTLMAGALFEVVDGRLHLLTNDQYAVIENANIETKAAILQTRNLTYNPFTYVMDTSDSFFDVRAYFLDSPMSASDRIGLGIYAKTFVAENETARLEISTLRNGLSRTETGYKLVVITRTGSVMKSISEDRVHAQLSFIPDGEVDRAYLNGELVGRTEDDEFIFEFNIDTQFDIDRQHLMQLTSFKMYNTEELTVGSPLRNWFDLVYIVSDYTVPGLEQSDIDDVQGRFLLPDDTVAIVREKLDVSFGTALDGLWRRSRSVGGSNLYRTHEEDVPAVYSHTIYRRDPATGAIDLTYNSETGEITYDVEHAVGDPVLDGDGQVVYAHRKGDVKLDSYGEPILISERIVERQLDLVVFDGAFALTTDTQAVNYARETTETVVHWVTDDVEQLSSRLLENTDLWYYPQVSMGSIDVTVEDGVQTRINAEQSFVVRYYLSRAAYDNLALRTDLSRTAITQISEHLNNTTISITEMAMRIKGQTGADVLDVTVSGLGGSNDYEMLSLRDLSQRISIRKRPVVLADNTLSMQDDVTVEFIRHLER